MQAELVISALSDASSQNVDMVKQAETRLSQLETQSGYYACLVQVYSLNASLPKNVRWMALICMKNGVDKYWRRTARK